MFISHMQVQANGEAARLAQMIEHLGGLPWLDMKATSLTAEGMLCGVRNSASLVLLLTSDVLTRRFCLLEINAAIDAGKFCRGYAFAVFYDATAVCMQASLLSYCARRRNVSSPGNSTNGRLTRFGACKREASDPMSVRHMCRRHLPRTTC